MTVDQNKIVNNDWVRHEIKVARYADMTRHDSRLTQLHIKYFYGRHWKCYCAAVAVNCNTRLLLINNKVVGDGAADSMGTTIACCSSLSRVLGRTRCAVSPTIFMVHVRQSMVSVNYWCEWANNAYLNRAPTNNIDLPVFYGTCGHTVR